MTEDELVGRGVDGGLDHEEVIRELVEATPSLQGPWREHLASWGDDPRGPYSDTPVISSYVVDSLAARNIADVQAILARAEELFQKASRDGRASLVVGLIEELQNISLSRGQDPEALLPYLSPEMSAAWTRVQAYWAERGATSVIDLVRADRGRPLEGRPAIDPSKIQNPELRMIVETLFRPGKTPSPPDSQ